MAKLTTEEFIAAIKELTVLELNELVKARFRSSRCCCCSRPGS